MKFEVIDGGWGRPAADSAERASAEAVRAEGVRRLKAAGYDEARVREFMTGRPMPGGLRYLKLQIDFAAEALCRLVPIPADFRDDRWWPPGGD